MRKILFIVLSFFLALAPSEAQEGGISLPSTSGEKLILSSDRNMYAVGEKVYFAIDYQCPEGFEYRGWSSVAYVELIRWDGKKIAQTKIPLSSKKGSGSMLIPGPTLSGNYYLRAYTLWMRNYSPTAYAYLQLTVLNPSHREVVSGPELSTPAPRPVIHKVSEAESGIRFAGLADSYERGDEVSFEIQLPDSLEGQNFHLGITKTSSTSSANCSLSMEEEEKDGESFTYLPEIGGLTLCGRVRDAASKAPVAGVRVQLSSYASSFFFSEEISDESGAFFFSLPHDGERSEFHITKAGDENYEIILASEFCNRGISLPHLPLDLDDEDLALAEEILINAQLGAKFSPLSELSLDGDASLSFYGSLATVTRVNEYIELDNLREVIYEIIPQVLVKLEKGKPYLAIQGPGCVDFYPPLVLMDNVPVSNDEILMNLPSGRIERIEVLNQGYVVGEQRYSGVFSIFSNKQDMAGMVHENDQYFFNFQMLENAPEKEADLVPESTLPDMRNLLLWKPGINFTDEASRQVEFDCPDAPGSYVISLRSTDSRGLPLLRQTSILVK